MLACLAVMAAAGSTEQVHLWQAQYCALVLRLCQRWQLLRPVTFQATEVPLSAVSWEMVICNRLYWHDATGGQKTLLNVTLDSLAY
jgi:hypothetical protein